MVSVVDGLKMLLADSAWAVLVICVGWWDLTFAYIRLMLRKLCNPS
jgi:hypothetical protein